MTDIKATKVAAEGGHWYRLTDDGVEQIQGVPRAKGEGMRKPTLRDARNAQQRGDAWLPGLTTITRQADAPALTRWQQKQAITAALQLDQQPDEQSEAYMRRVLAKASDTAAEAAEIGSAIHAAIEAHFSGQPFDKFYRAHVLGVADLLEQLCPAADELDPWLAEVGVAHSSGFATRVDLHSQGWIWDFKTKDGTPDEWAGPNGRIATYGNHHMQLAACRKACEERFGWPPGQQRCGIIYVSRTHGGLCEAVEVREDRLEQGWDMFQGLLAYWKAANRYDPTEVRS